MRGLWRLYPARWRARYGPEFEALLETQPVTARVLLDVVLGAFDAHLTADEEGAGMAVPSRTPRSLLLALGGLVILDVGLRLWWLSSYLSPSVFGFSISEPLLWFGMFPVVLLPLAWVGSGSHRRPPRLVLAGTLLLAAAELLYASLDAFVFLSPVGLTSPIPAAISTAATDVMGLGLAVLAFGLRRSLPRSRSTLERPMAAAILLAVVFVAVAAALARPEVVLELWTPVLTLPAAYLAWVCVTARTDGSRPVTLAALGALLVLASLLLTPLLLLVPEGLGALSGGNFRWDVRNLISGLGFLALVAALVGERRSWVSDLTDVPEPAA